MSRQDPEFNASELPSMLVFPPDSSSQTKYSSIFYSSKYTGGRATVHEVNQVLKGVHEIRDVYNSKPRYIIASGVFFYILDTIATPFVEEPSSSTFSMKKFLFNVLFSFGLCFLLSIIVTLTGRRFMKKYINLCNAAFLQRGLKWCLPNLLQGEVELRQKISEEQKASTILTGLPSKPSAEGYSNATASYEESQGRNDINHHINWSEDSLETQSKIVFLSNTWLKSGLLYNSYLLNLTNGRASVREVQDVLSQISKTRRPFVIIIDWSYYLFLLVSVPLFTILIKFEAGVRYPDEVIRKVVMYSLIAIASRMISVVLISKIGKFFVKRCINESNFDFIARNLRWHLPGSFHGNVELLKDPNRSQEGQLRYV